ncbi:MAG: bacteriohemerythrin [Sulfurihydrogenibium sp.]
MIEVKEDIFIGIEDMDEQHLKLLELLNKVMNLLHEGKKEEAMHLFDREILDYTEKHLADEEKFMESIEYPDLENHKKIHELFRREVQNLAPYIEQGDPKAFREALALAWGWLYNHITKTDRKYAIYARERCLI